MKMQNRLLRLKYKFPTMMAEHTIYCEVFHPRACNVLVSSKVCIPEETIVGLFTTVSLFICNLNSTAAPIGVALSSNSESSKSGSSSMDNPVVQKDPSSHKSRHDFDEDQTQGDGNNHNLAKDVKLEKHAGHQDSKHSVWMLSSDSESCPDNSLVKEDCSYSEELSELKTSQFRGGGKDDKADIECSDGKSKSRKVSVRKSPRKQLKLQDHILTKEKIINCDKNQEGSDCYVRNGGDVEIAEKDALDECIAPPVSSSRLPLVLSDKVQRLKALVECEGKSIDLSGDMGAVGRVVISDSSSANHELYLDLKGTLYRTSIVPSRTFCIVSFGQSEAKIETIMNDFIQLKAQSNVDEAETMVEGTLDGFSFDSEDDAEKTTKAATSTADQNEAAEDGPHKKSKKKAEKAPGVARKRGKTGGKQQPPKKSRKKTQASKAKSTKSKK